MSTDAENAGPKQRGRPWPKGRSGNPTGKPKGTRHRVTQAAEALLEGEAEAITRKAIELAKAGDTVALRLVLERILPPRKGRPVDLRLPAVKQVADLLVACEAVTAAMANGEITPDEAATVVSVMEVVRKSIETVDLERRLSALEAQGAKS